MKTSELTGIALDWAVAKCGFVQGTARSLITSEVKPYSTDWAQGGPIIEREEIDITCIDGPEEIKWKAIRLTRNKKSVHVLKGSTPLIAAMRCFVTYKLGDEVEIPEELNV
jgi:hypothetical protein